jgi:hypothetical protein
MPTTDAQEVKELRSLLARRPPWDSTPLRSRPAALVGLKPVTREPWAVDEDVYNRRFETRDVGIPDRYLDKTARAREMGYKLTGAFNAINMK